MKLNLCLKTLKFLMIQLIDQKIFLSLNISMRTMEEEIDETVGSLDEKDDEESEEQKEEEQISYPCPPPNERI